MAQIVKCDVCGKIYNQSYLGSHKRLSHGKREAPPRASKDESATIEKILSMFELLPAERKKEVLGRLAAKEQGKP